MNYSDLSNSDKMANVKDIRRDTNMFKTSKKYVLGSTGTVKIVMTLV